MAGCTEPSIFRLGTIFVKEWQNVILHLPSYYPQNAQKAFPRQTNWASWTRAQKIDWSRGTNHRLSSAASSLFCVTCLFITISLSENEKRRELVLNGNLLSTIEPSRVLSFLLLPFYSTAPLFIENLPLVLQLLLRLFFNPLFRWVFLWVFFFGVDGRGRVLWWYITMRDEDG